MISNQERLDKCEHTSPMKTGRKGYVRRIGGGLKDPLGADKLEAGNCPGDAGRCRFNQFGKNMRIDRSYFQLFELLAFLAAGLFFEECALGYFQRGAFGTAGRNDFGFAGFFFGFANKLHRLATHHRALALCEDESGAAQQDQKGHQDGD